MKGIEVPIVGSNTEWQGTRHSSVAARGVGGAPDRDSLSTREANGATVLMEEDTAAVTKLFLVWLIVEVREIYKTQQSNLGFTVCESLWKLRNYPEIRAT